MSEVTLVTAFFEINRSTWVKFPRTEKTYLAHFEHWARMKNNLIVYTMPELVDDIKAIRKKYGLEDKTTVIPVEDVTKVVPDIYQKIKYAMKNRDSWLFHEALANPECWNYRYNYVTCIKSYWVQRAVQDGLANGIVAWIDFGFDHGGEDFPYSEDFNFLWDYDFSPKIHIFLLSPLNDDPIFKVVQTMGTYIRGNITVAPDYLWPVLWKDIYEALKSLTECGMADDDQTLMLMAYRRHPENFELHMASYWGEGLGAYGGERSEGRFTNLKGIMLFIDFGGSREETGRLNFRNGRPNVVLRNDMQNELKGSISKNNMSFYTCLPLLAEECEAK